MKATSKISQAPILKKFTTKELNALLVQVGVNRKRRAFAKLFEYFGPRIKSFLMRGALSEGKAEELTQEVFVTIWQKAGSFNPAKASASTWVFTIARNKKIDFFRKNLRRKIDPDAYEAVRRDVKSQFQDVQERNEADVIGEILKELPEKQADLIRKCYYEDKTHQAIADELGIPLGTVKSRLRLGIKKIRRALSKKGIQKLGR